MIKIGVFLFKFRNFLFPLYILGLFILFRPPVSKIFGSEQLLIVQDLVAALIAIFGLIVRGVVIGLAYIKRGGLNKKVYAENLVTEGMFSVSRNPLYVGNMLIYVGQFLMFGNYFCFVIGFFSFFLIYECIIAAEESYLRNKFGLAFDEYCSDVRRWMPNLGKIGEAVTGMKFDWKKVVFKDYSTMCSTLTILALLQLWKVLANKGYDNYELEVYGLASFVVIVSLAAVIVRKIKKSTARFPVQES